MGSIVAEMTISYLYFKNCNGFLGVKQVLMCSYKRLIAGTVMFFLVRAVSHCGLSGLELLMFELITGATTYFIILVILKDNMLYEAYLMIKERMLKHG